MDTLCKRNTRLYKTSGILKLVFPVLDSTIEERMEVLMAPSAMSKPVGETVLLPCVVKGFPLPVIRWMRNSKVVDER